MKKSKSTPKNARKAAAARAKTATKKAATKKTPKKAATKAKTAPKKVSPVPAGYHTVTPVLVCRNAAGAIDFYKKAFSAKEISRMPMPDGTVAHAELQIGDSRIMLGDEVPAMGASAPQTVGGSPVHIFLYVPNVDQMFQRATAAGATPDMPPMDMFWGDRYGKLTDPFGHKWNLATHIEDVSEKDMISRGKEAMAQQG